MTYTAADLTFDAEAHRSWLPDGRDVPHVTAVIGAAGLGEDFDLLAARSPRLGQQIDLARQRGTAVHADCHAYDDDDLDWKTVDFRVLPYVEAWTEARHNLGLVPVAHGRERRLYYDLYNYTGILDGVFMRAARRILVDIKTGDPESAGARWQTAAYGAAWERMHPDQPIDQRWAVWLTPGHRVPYRVHDYSSEPDAHNHFGVFLAALTVYNARQRRVRA